MRFQRKQIGGCPWVVALALALGAAPLTAQNGAIAGPATLSDAVAQAESPGHADGERPGTAAAEACGASSRVCALWAGMDGTLPLPPVAGAERVPEVASAVAPVATPVVQARNRRGIPFIVAGAALLVGGAIVGDDAGTLLMVGGVLVSAWGLYIYF